jgi:hypothetical protein
MVFVFFYLAGLVISLLTLKNRKLTVASIFLFWIIFVICIPSISSKYTLNKSSSIQSEEKINLQKLTNLLDFDKKALDIIAKMKKGSKEEELEIYKELISEYFNGVYESNKNAEYGNIKKLRDIIESNKKMSLIFPTTYHAFLQSEISSSGHDSFLKFFDYIMKTREGFIKFFLNKKYILQEKKVESFIKGEENIFRAESRLPDNFWAGVAVTGLYCLVLFGISILLLKSRLKTKVRDKNRYELQPMVNGKSYFVRCRNEAVRDSLFKQLAASPGTLSLDRVTAADLDLGLPPNDIIPYLCHIRGFQDKDKVHRYVAQLGVEDLKYYKYKKRGELSAEDLKRIYCAVILAEEDDKETILINGFASGASMAFDKKFREILDRYKAKGKKIIYLNEEPYMTASESELDELGIYQVSLKIISLR